MTKAYPAKSHTHNWETFNLNRNDFLLTAISLGMGLLLTSTVFASDTQLEGASDWTMYHYNPQHTGYNDKDNIVVPLQLLWSKQFTEIPVPLEPITAVGDRIIVTNENEFNERLGEHSLPAFRCVDATDGSIIWSKEFGEIEVKTFDQASYFDGRIYMSEIARPEDRIAVYDLSDGTLNYWIVFPAQLDDPLGSVFYNQTLYFPSGISNGLGSFDPVSKTVNWWVDLFQVDRWTPSFHENTIYIWIAGTLFAHDLSNGAKKWHIQPEWDLYFDTTGLGRRATIDFYRGSFAPTIDTANDMLFLIHGLHFWGTGFYGINYETQEIIWNYDHGYENSLRSVVPSLCDGIVYSAFGTNYIAFDGLTGAELHRYRLDTVTSYPSVIANGLIFVSTVSETVVLDLNTFEKVWEYPVGGYVTVANNRLFIATSTGEVFAFGNLQTAVEPENETALPETFVLEQNYPNPFNPSTTIEFSLPTNSHVNLSVINVLGQRIRILLDRELTAGHHVIEWDGRDKQGHLVSSGVYIYELTSEHYTDSKTMLLAK